MKKDPAIAEAEELVESYREALKVTPITEEFYKDGNIRDQHLQCVD